MNPNYDPNEHSGQKFFVNVEGEEYPWDSVSISTQEIRTLGNIPSDIPVIQEAPQTLYFCLAA